MNFKKEINGLRAIAVLAVLIYHFTPQALPHGYLGVDIFFVISGYLITKIITKDLVENNFSIREFYLRRIKRILPATLTALLASTLVAYFILLAPDLIRFARSLTSSLSFLANIYFWRTGGYFGTNEELKPLLHLWSLGVEEQFYLIFPITLIIIFKFIKSDWIRQLAILTIVVASYGLNLYLIKIGGENPAFFLLPTRVWQFLLGAYFATSPSYTFKNATLNNWIINILILLLISSLFWPLNFLPNSTITSLSTALLLSTKWNQISLNQKLLSVKIIQLIGTISFSLYLWHWPILAYLRYVSVTELSSLIIFIGMLSTAILSYFSWKYIEEPFRKKISNRAVFFFIGISYIILITSSIGVISHKGFPERDSKAANIIASAIDTNFRCELSTLKPYGSSRACFFNVAKDKSYTVALLGNSHAQMYAPAFISVLNKNKKNGVLIPLNGCLPTTTVNISNECIVKANINFNSIFYDEKIRTVVIALTWNSNDLVNDKGDRFIDSDYTQRDQSLLKLASRFREAGKSVFLIGPIATPEFDFASISSRQIKFGKETSLVTKTLKSTFESQHQKSITYFKENLGENFLLPHERLCDREYCYFSDDNGSYYADSNHLGEYGASMMDDIFQKINLD